MRPLGYSADAGVLLVEDEAGRLFEPLVRAGRKPPARRRRSGPWPVVQDGGMDTTLDFPAVHD
jgi:hypothetical protein